MERRHGDRPCALTPSDMRTWLPPSDSGDPGARVRRSFMI
jgi:hypothetical protein